jgi:hypothetical protein
VITFSNVLGSNVPKTLEKVIALANTLDANLVLCKENTQNGFRVFNSLNQGNPQKPQNQEAYCINLQKLTKIILLERIIK